MSTSTTNGFLLTLGLKPIVSRLYRTYIRQYEVWKGPNIYRSNGLKYKLDQSTT